MPFVTRCSASTPAAAAPKRNTGAKSGYRSDGKRLGDLFEALAENDGFSAAVSDPASSLEDQLRDTDVLVIASRIPPVVSEGYAKLLDRLFGSRDTQSFAFQPEEVGAITDFVAGGGGLLLMTNHGDLPVPGRSNGMDWAHQDRILADAFGITIESAWFPGPIPSAVAAIEGDCLDTVHPIIRGAPGEGPVRSVVTAACSAVSASGGAVPLVRLADDMIDMRTGRHADGRCFAVALDAASERRGRVVVGTRSGILGSEGTEFPAPGMFRQGDNGRFLVNSIRWLAHTL